MKIYLAGPWISRQDMPAIEAYLNSKGHTITHQWWKYDGEGEHAESPEYLKQCAKADQKGVKDCDALICINTHKSEGKAVEQGLAIAYEKPIILVTPGDKPSSNVFHYMNDHYFHCKTIQEAVEALQEQYS